MRIAPPSTGRRDLRCAPPMPSLPSRAPRPARRRVAPGARAALVTTLAIAASAPRGAGGEPPDATGSAIEPMPPPAPPPRRPTLLKPVAAGVVAGVYAAFGAYAYLAWFR